MRDDPGMERRDGLQGGPSGLRVEELPGSLSKSATRAEQDQWVPCREPYGLGQRSSMPSLAMHAERNHCAGA